MDTYQIIKKIILAACLVLVCGNSYSQKHYSDLRWKVDGIYYTTAAEVNDENLVKEVYVTNTETNYDPYTQTQPISRYVGYITVPPYIVISGREIPVTRVESYAFYCSDIISLTLPSSVTQIDSHAFVNCRILKNIIMPGVINLGYNAFRGCTRLEKITIPEYLTSISPTAFIENPALLEFEVDEKNSSLCAYDGVIYNKEKTRLIIFPTAKETLVFPNTLKEIGYSSFQNSVIESVDLPPTVELIKGNAFANAENLREIIIPNSVDSIGGYTFSGCTSLTSVKLSSEITSIPDGMFENCKSLKNLVIPDKVTEIGKDAFSFTGFTGPDDSRMQNLTLGRSVKTIDRDAFSSSFVKNMYSLAPIPPKIIPELFYDEPPYPNEPPAFSLDIILSCNLYVPANSVPLYKSEKEWWNIEHILPMDASAEATTDSGCDFSITGGSLYVNAMIDEEVNIFTIDGILRYKAIGPSEVELPSGYYILLIGHKSRKIFI